MEQTDLFETLVRFLAIKPLKLDKFNLEEAKSLIKKENEGAITFIADHGYFEDIIEETANKVGDVGQKNGVVHLYLKGRGCTTRMQRNLLRIIMGVRTLIIFGDPADWSFNDPRIKFVNPEGQFADNHQRFFIYQSPSFNVALVARHTTKLKKEVIEGALTNKGEAVSLLSQMVGTKSYKQFS